MGNLLQRAKTATLYSPVASLQLKLSTTDLSRVSIVRVRVRFYEFMSDFFLRFVGQETRYILLERMKLIVLFSMVFQLLILLSDVEAKGSRGSRGSRGGRGGGGGFIIIFTENGGLSVWGVLILISTLLCTLCGCICACISNSDSDSDSDSNRDNNV